MFSILRYLGDTYGVKERDIRARDLLQPPTYITIGSFLLTLNGSRKLDTPLGKLEVIIGRSGDAVDGVVARAFDMSSDAGAIADQDQRPGSVGAELETRVGPDPPREHLTDGQTPGQPA